MLSDSYFLALNHPIFNILRYFMKIYEMWLHVEDICHKFSKMSAKFGCPIWDNILDLFGFFDKLGFLNFYLFVYFLKSVIDKYHIIIGCLPP